MRFQDCKLEVAVKITVVDENDSTLSLTIFSEVIEKFLGVGTTVLSADEIAEKLLLSENLKILFNQDMVVSQMEHQSS